MNSTGRGHISSRESFQYTKLTLDSVTVTQQSETSDTGGFLGSTYAKTYPLTLSQYPHEDDQIQAKVQHLTEELISEKKAPIVKKLGEADYTRNRDRKMHIVIPGTSTTLLPEGPLRRVRGVNQRKPNR